jgi:hypothetical protein
VMLDSCITAYCLHYDTDVFVHDDPELPWVDAAVALLEKDRSAVSVSLPWSYQEEASPYTHAEMYYGKKFTSHGFTARAFLWSRAAMLGLSPLPLVRNIHWEGLVSEAHARGKTHALELTQAYVFLRSVNYTSC